MKVTHSRRISLLLALVAAAATAGCDREVTAPTGADAAQFAAAKVVGPAAVMGEIGPGAKYALYLPAEWNGELVVYAHGYCGFPPGMDDPAMCLPGAGMVNQFLAAGYGFAASSFSSIGMAVKDGAIRTAQLKALFTAEFGRPLRTYLMSESMGGAVAMRIAEANPQKFDGVVPICGIVGGLPFQLDYYATVRTLFDYYYPDVLPAEPVSTPFFSANVVPAIMAAIGANAAAAVDLAAVDQVDLRYRDPGELFWAITYPLMFITSERFYGDLLDRTHDRYFFDNSDVWYSGSADDEALNEGVVRFSAHPDTRNLLEQWYEPTGKLKVPVLSLHAVGDPIVPIMHETRYAALVQAAGGGQFLLQRFTEDYGAAAHCNFTTAQKVAALEDLADWVRTGVKPAS